MEEISEECLCLTEKQGKIECNCFKLKLCKWCCIYTAGKKGKKRPWIASNEIIHCETFNFWRTVAESCQSGFYKVSNY